LQKGFYYDIDLGDRKLSEEDLLELEKENGRTGPNKNNVYPAYRKNRRRMAVAYFTEKGG